MRPVAGLLLVPLVLACGGDTDDDTSAGTAPTTDATATDSTAGSTGDGSSSGTSTSSTSSPSTSTTASSSTSTTSDTTSDTTGAGCAADANDDDCRTCIKDNCCLEYQACQNDTACKCLLDCHLGGKSLGNCKSTCNADGETYKVLYFCGQMTCLNTCDWDCC